MGQKKFKKTRKFWLVGIRVGEQPFINRVKANKDVGPTGLITRVLLFTSLGHFPI